MVKITLYNIGGYKKKCFLYYFVDFFCTCCLCIPNILKESKEDICLEYNVSTLRILPLRELHSIQSSQFKCYAKHITAQHQAIYPIKSIMASPCKLNKNIFYVHVYKKNRNAIIYIYIIYRNMKTIISKIINIRKKFLTEHY